MKFLILSILAIFLAISAKTQNFNAIKIDHLFDRKVKNKGIDREYAFDIIQELLNDDISFKKVKENLTSLKKTDGQLIHEQFQQFYKGIKVEDGVYIVHSNNNKVVSINGNIIQIKDFNTNDKIAVHSALEISLNFINAKKYVWESLQDEVLPSIENALPKGELLFIRDSLNNLRLSYKFIINSLEPYDNWLVYVDALSGELIKTNSMLENSNDVGTAATRYSGTRTIYTTYSSIYDYYLYNYNYGTSAVYNNQHLAHSLYFNRISDNDNNWTAAEWDNQEEDNIALDIIWTSWNVKEFLHEVIGINSYDNNYGALKSWIHYGSNYQNASSWPNDPNMIFGDGDGINSGQWGSLDIVSHEIGHKMIYFALNSNNLNDGGLKEGFCDIFAIAAENYIAPEKEAWHFGEDITITSSFLRSFASPNSPGYNGTCYADTYGGLYWNGTSYQKSTVLSHWFYIFNEGKSGTNDLGNTFNVEGINNINESSSIVYNVLNNYLSGTSSFQDVKEQSIAYLQNVYGEVAEESINAMQAWYAVGVPGDCNVLIENTTIDNSSPFAVLDVGDCSIKFNNLNYTTGTNARYKAGTVEITYNFEVPVGATFEIE
jgi:Zn-dependent metalloprotease